MCCYIKNLLRHENNHSLLSFSVAISSILYFDIILSIIATSDNSIVDLLISASILVWFGNLTSTISLLESEEVSSSHVILWVFLAF